MLYYGLFWFISVYFGLLSGLFAYDFLIIASIAETLRRTTNRCRLSGCIFLWIQPPVCIQAADFASRGRLFIMKQGFGGRLRPAVSDNTVCS